MKRTTKFLLFAILTTILFCTAISNAQVREPDVQVNLRLPDGSVILTIDGVKYRALTVEHLRKMQEMSVSFQSCVKENEILQLQNQSLKSLVEKVRQDAAVADAQTINERKRGDEYKKLLEDERALRLQAEKLKKQNIFEKILNHPITQVVLVGTAGVIAAKQ